MQKMMLALTGLILLLALAGCSVRRAIIKSTPPGEVLFRDDFSDPNSGWDRVTAQDGETNYDSEFYRIWVNEPYTDLLANPGLSLADVRLDVDATKAGGPDDNIFGLICRASDSGDQYYFFVISSDGYYGIGRVDGASQRLLTADQLMPSDVIRLGNKTNVLRADCIGSTLAFYVNEQKLAEVEDSSYRSGDIGLTAGTFDEPNVDIYFDNLLATKP